MVNIREQIEVDLETTLEGDFGLPIELIAPDGVEYTGLTGQVLYDSVDENDVFSGHPVAVLRISSLTRVPIDGENWAIKIPESPSTTATLVTYLLDKPIMHGKSIGFIKLYLTKSEQS
jgi:hypothetical protein